MVDNPIVLSLKYISDDMIEEAMLSKGRAKLRVSKSLLNIAACFGVILALSVVALTIEHYHTPVADIEPFTSMSLDDIEGSIYAKYVPELESIGYNLDSAGVYNSEVFKASYYSEHSEVNIVIEGYSPDLHDNRIVDIESTETLLDNKDPIFRAEQFGMECMEYIAEQKTATNQIVTQFSIICDGNVIRYIIESSMQDEITKAFEHICLCYN
jgi:hypothetical protein